MRAGVSGRLLHCVVNDTRSALVQWFQNGFGLGAWNARCPAGNVTATIDGSVAFITYVCVVV